MNRNNRRHMAFTLLESLLASMILGLTVVMVCSISSRNLSNIRADQDYEQAWTILDQQFMALTQIGIKDFIEKNITQGTVDNEITDDDSVEYQWQAIVQEDSLLEDTYNVRLTLSWIDGKSRRKISAESIFYDDKQEEQADVLSAG